MFIHLHTGNDRRAVNAGVTRLVHMPNKGWCTDQNIDDKVFLEHELKSYSVMFSMSTPPAISIWKIKSAPLSPAR